ncbi:LysR family transcriptional regulator, pca operon transcriptional activator [Devosia psychrophila]|uniref:LysR family transcriptional regulator, pca operon transcriptional activator n=1 Tax=Devosia psychrophila TaxID=728005 RepID=A0A1I1MG72_9HYPH|nr:LysR family transcriptional regulator, pca operon transcriptional activator [Devosia psychrophila]
MAQRIIDPRIKLRHLTCFLEVARLKSVVNAAEVLNISQPAASRTIQELEQVLGGSLFDRSKRNLFLTPFGEVFYRYAATSMAALRQGIDLARGTHEAAIVRVGALPTVSARILPSAVQAFTATGSGVHTRVVTGPNDYLLTLLRTGDVDFVIGRMAEPDVMLGLSFEHLYSERVVFVVRPGHALLSERSFDLSMVENYQTLVPPPGSVIRRLVERMLVANGVTELRDEVETVSNAFGRAYVRQTDAIWIISEGVVAEDIADKHLMLLPVDSSETTGPVGLTTRTDMVSTLAAESLKQAVRDAAASLR